MRQVAWVGAAAALLLWPAWLNGYPLVFSDTGTYLSQVPHHHLGWDRPPFYSAFLLVLSWQRTTWTAVAVQALATSWLLDVTRRVLLPVAPRWFTLVIAGVLSGLSALPWVVSQLMPDAFTGLLVLALVALVLAGPPLLRLGERMALVLFASFAIAAHLSHVPLAIGLVALLIVARRWMRPSPRPAWEWTVAPVLLAMIALFGVNLAARGALSIAPYDNLFLLARVIYDGPGRDALDADCPSAGWGLCPWRYDLPPTADDFLWRTDSPLTRAGGPQRVSAEADAIIRAAWRDEPGRMSAAVLRNTAEQLAAFGTGDGLQPWPVTVMPWINGDFPSFERAAYVAARQTNGQVLVPAWLCTTHILVSLGGCIVSLCLLPGFLRRHSPLGLAIAALFPALVLNAFITGALSGPHARYQSRIMWLPVLTATLGLAEGRWAEARRAFQ